MQKFINLFQETLSAAVGVEDTTLLITDATALELGSKDHYIACLESVNGVEIIKITSVNANSLGIERGLEGTTALSFDSGDKIEIRNTAKSLEDMKQRRDGQDSALTMLLRPNQTNGWKDIYRSGFRPWGFSQQWGGANWGGSPDGDLMEGYATAQIKSGATSLNLSNLDSQAWRSTGFKVSETQDLTHVWLKVGKTGNPTDFIEVQIHHDDGTGKSNNLVVAGGISELVAGKSLSTELTWVKFVFSGTVNLLKDTQYHLAVTRDDPTAYNGINYYNLCYGAGDVLSDNSITYPFGGLNTGSNSAAPVWAMVYWSRVALTFLLNGSQPLLMADTSLDTSDAKLAFSQGLPLNQSKAVTADLKGFFSHKEFSVLVRGSSWEKSKPIFDAVLGQDSNRITLRMSATGKPQLTYYASNGDRQTSPDTVHPDVSTGLFDILVSVRAYGDGGDYAKVEVIEIATGLTTSTACPFSANILFAPSFQEQGTLWVGGGFELAPIWTEDEDMSVLPSANNWVFSTTTAALEANIFTVADGKLYQNAAALTSENGYYSVASPVLSAANGYGLSAKVQVLSATGDSAARLDLASSTSQVLLSLQPDHIKYYDGANWQILGQVDLQSKAREIVILSKGADFFVFIDGDLLFDGTGRATGTVSALIRFGNTTSSEYADVIWYSVKYIADLGASTNLLDFSNGAELHELGFWQKDATSFLPYLNDGSGKRTSIKDFVGLKENIVKEIDQLIECRGISSSPYTSSTAFVSMDEMNCFLLSKGKTEAYLNSGVQPISSGSGYIGIGVNSVPKSSSSDELYFAIGSTATDGVSITKTSNIVGLAFVSGYYKAYGSSTLYLSSKRRKLIIKG